MQSILLAAMILGDAAADASPNLSGISPIELRDQYGPVDSLDADRGHVVVATAVAFRSRHNAEPDSVVMTTLEKIAGDS
jgi:hypothetical protein